MSAYELSEGVVDDVIAVLAAGMAAKLDSIYAEKGDFDTPDIQAWYRAEQRAIDKFPAAIVRVNMAKVVEEHSAHLKLDYEVLVGILHMEQDSAKLIQSLQRYQRAVLEVIKAGEAAGSIPDMVLLQELNESPVFSPAESEYAADMSVTFTVRRKEAA